jgi:prepilin-type N-terminal cleavage/methylation domain-containing protein
MFSACALNQRCGDMRRAFTFVELLMVMLIVAVFMALLLPLVNALRFHARAADTGQRLRGVELALRAAGANESPALRLHQGVIAPALVAAGLSPGVTEFQASVGYAFGWNGDSNGGGLMVPVKGSWLVPHAYAWAYPWGQGRLDDQGGLTSTIEAHNYRALSPLATPAFLRFAGIMRNDDDWLKDRNTSRPWNDAWGNPLVIAFALYQPMQNTTVTSTWLTTSNSQVAKSGILPDLYLKQANKTYGYTRAVYIGLGSVGPVVRTQLATDAVNLANDLWTQVTDVCAASQWDEQAWEHRPQDWHADVRWGRKGRERSCLTAPIDLR